MENLTPDQVMGAVIVVLAVFAAIITVDKVVDIVKKWKAPGVDTATKLGEDKRRLDEHEEDIQMLKDSHRVLCAGVLALLDHELHNGNTEQMQSARDDILRFLQGQL